MSARFDDFTFLFLGLSALKNQASEKLTLSNFPSREGIEGCVLTHPQPLQGGEPVGARSDDFTFLSLSLSTLKNQACEKLALSSFPSREGIEGCVKINRNFYGNHHIYVSQ